MKCGASVKFHGGERLISDYNILGAAAGSRGKLAEVFADEATIMSMGFPHFSTVCQHYSSSSYSRKENYHITVDDFDVTVNDF